ncbi:MAG: SCO family protein [Bdellovibrionota bacterium]
MKTPKVSWLLTALVAMPILAVGLFAFTSDWSVAKPLRHVPDFNLVDTDGNEVSNTDLLGKVWVASFIFTRCEGMCPLLNKKTEKLQEFFGKDPHFRTVSISVDPEADTPSVLGRYAARYRTNPGSWIFLTGERASIKDLLQSGFQVVMPGMEDAQTGMITHSNSFVVVDREGAIRGHFDMDDENSMIKVKRSVHKYLGRRF